ncbi:enoyl-CoA hydratase-related protein [Brachybacterium sp. Z12]|uniref:enoyl-CoA hydratase-related protein n=1 Tax=Brachybacterium sp. Z12 TaxID=2759167 RepID=UPI00223BAEB8|nr:enoyl-CoA hydratase-related protein [Brachybacterium sp. Z12]
MTRAAHDLQIRVRASSVPVLAHLNGVALGGGLEVALMADVRTATPAVRGLGLPETSLGILPGWGGTTLLQSVVGAETAVRMILEDPARDKQLNAEQALEIGLVDELAEDLDEALDEFAALVAAHVDLDESDADVVDPALAESAPDGALAADGAWGGRTAPVPAADTPRRRRCSTRSTPPMGTPRPAAPGRPASRRREPPLSAAPSPCCRSCPARPSPRRSPARPLRSRSSCAATAPPPRCTPPRCCAADGPAAPPSTAPVRSAGWASPAPA